MSGFGGGKKRLSKRLAAMPNGVRKALRAQNRKNAEELVQTMKDFAPIQDGALVSSIKRKDVSNSTRITQRISAGNREAPYAAWVEFGTKGSEGEAPRQNKNYRRTEVMTKGKRAHAATEAQPFFWPAYRLKRRRFSARMMRAAKKAMREAGGNE